MKKKEQTRSRLGSLIIALKLISCSGYLTKSHSGGCGWYTVLLNGKQKSAKGTSLKGIVCPVKKLLLFPKATQNSSPASRLGNSEGTSRLSPNLGKAFYREASCWGREQVAH